MSDLQGKLLLTTPATPPHFLFIIFSNMYIV